MTVTQSMLRLTAGTLSGIPCDRPRSSRQGCASGAISLAIDHATADGLRTAARTVDGDLSDALTAAFAWWLHLYTDSTKVVFGSAGNRVTPLLVASGVSGHESFSELLVRIRRVLAEALYGVEASDSVDSALVDIGTELDGRDHGRLVGEFAFDPEVFDRETARAMASHWGRLLDAVAAEPTRPMADHDVVTAEERQRQLSWNRTSVDAVSSRCVHELIRSQVERTPDAAAITAGGTTLTYRQLDDRAGNIASSLVQAGVKPGALVALLLGRTPDVAAAILGVLMSGAAFLPLDPRHPATRNSLCIKDAGATVILTDRELPAGDEATSATVVKIGDVGAYPPRQHTVPDEQRVSSTDLAYVICTSGSTGHPKPVLVEHRGATNLMRNLVSEFGIRSGDTVLSVASISFDMALFDIFSALVCGARVVLATPDQAVNPASLSGLIADRGATFMFTTPTTWAALIAGGWSGDRRLRAASGGETLTEGLAEALLQRCGAVWNGYGPTEATAGTSIARLVKGDSITVGTPLPNVRVYITDRVGRLQPVGVPGEICIGGVGVGRGYLNRPDEQASRFADDPFHADGRIYRTGDRGRFLPDGRLQHLGRYDEQFKIRGCRIEPGEIESVLCEHPAVGACAVAARESPFADAQLVAYIVGEPGGLSGAEARDWLRRRLPEYMVPNAFVQLPVLPMTPSGKLDKAALPAPPPLDMSVVDAQPPRTDTEARVAALWGDLLGTPVTDIRSDFFDLGGNSLSAARLISEVKRVFGVALSLESFIDSGRIVGKLAELLSAESPDKTGEVDTNPPLHFIFADSVSAMSLRHFAAQWGTAQPVHPLVPEQPSGLFDRSVTIEELARQTLSTIRDRQPTGPLALVGYSIGGLLAYEVARQSVAAGQQIEWLCILDTTAPPLKRTQLTMRWRLRSIRHRPARERWAKYATASLRVIGSRVPLRQRGFDYRGVTTVGKRYRLPGHRVPMHLFVSEATAAAAGNNLLGWDEFHQGPITGHLVAGDHTSLLRQSEAARLAEIMFESLCAARESLFESGRT